MIPVWLIEPPADVTSSRLALVVGSTTLPAVALNSAGPDVETLPLPVEVTEVPVKETLLPETGPPIVIVPVVVKFITDPATNARMGERVAAVTVPRPPTNVMLGADVKPEPPAPSVRLLTEPVATAAVAVVPVPPPPANVTAGALV